MADAVFTIYCPTSGHRVLVGCACDEVGHPAGEVGYHHDRCQMRNLTANLPCAGTVGCCGEDLADHDCEAIANACPGAATGHDGAPCPVPDACGVHEPAKAHHAAMREAHQAHRELVAAGRAEDVRHAFLDLPEPPEACPGGHCHAGLPDCTVHHPVVITAGLAAATLRPVTS